MYAVKTSNQRHRKQCHEHYFQSQSPYWANDLTLKCIDHSGLIYDAIQTDIFFKYLKTLIESNEYHFSLLWWELKLNYGRKET